VKIGDVIVTPGGWVAVVRSGKSKAGTITIEWRTGPLRGREARILHKGCRITNPQLEKAKTRRRARIISRGGKVIV